MDILDESFGQQPANLDDLLNTTPLNSSVPSSSIRNRAAMDALLSSKPEDMVENYRLLVKEGEEGNDTTHDRYSLEREQFNRTRNMGPIINILGDPNLPYEQKQKVFNLIQTQGFKEEPAITLRTNALASPSAGESTRAESARISTADMIDEIQADAERKQKMMNSFAVTLPDASSRTVGELAEAEVMPFGRNVIAANINQAIREKTGQKNNWITWIGDFLTPGSTKKSIQDRLASIPVDQRDEFRHTVLNGIKDSKTIFFNNNYYSQYKNAEELLNSVPMTSSEAWVENMMTAFDAFWIGEGISRLRGGKKVANEVTRVPKREDTGAPNSYAQNGETAQLPYVEKADWEVVGDPTNPMQIGKPKDRIGYKNPDDDLKRIKLNSVVRQENPVSPFSILEQSNPEQARRVHQSVVNAPTDELAEAVAGVSKEQFVANNVLPQAGTESGSVLYKVDQTIKDGVEDVGAIRFTDNELRSAQEKIRSDFRNVEGLQINDAMTTFRYDGDRIFVDGHYNAPGGSFDSVAEAKEQAKFYFREMGLRDDEIEIMKRVGTDYVPYKGDEAVTGDYIIKVKTTREIQNDDVIFEGLDVKRNFFDRYPFLVWNKGGSVSRFLFDAASMLHSTLTGAASVAVDKVAHFENVLIKPIEELRNSFERFSAVSRSKMEEYIKEANLKQIKFDPVNLRANGFNQDEINTLAKWKDIQDGHYYLENLDLIRNLRSQGYQLFENAGDRFFAKAVQKNQNIAKVYDPSIQDIRVLTKDEMDDLYNSGGTYARLRRPETINGQTVDHIIVRNTPTEYLKGLRDTDRVLNYRDGYYTIYYKAPKFVEQSFIDPITNKKQWRAVAVAGSTEEANIFKSNALNKNPGNEYHVRGDNRAMRTEDDVYWDIHSGRGRIAQRQRGQTLEDASGLQHLGDGNYISHPMESAVRSAKSIANRSMMRKILETAKARAVAQYAEHFPPDGMGGKMFPSSVKDISGNGNPFGKGFGDSSVADARTTVEFINFLERGYVNSTDDFYKASMNILSNWLGAMGLTKAEKLASAAERLDPTHLAKASVFQAYIGFHPLRNLFVQPHQAMRMLAFNPKGFAKAGELAYSYLFNKMRGTSDDFYEFVEKSGALAGVDQNNLVRGMKLDLADSASKPKRLMGQIASAPQEYGFNKGEQFNQLLHLANVYEKRVREGVDLSKAAAREEAYRDSRALSYNMNKAGDFPYTQNALGSVFQFMQVPHKALLQMTNRQLKSSDVARLVAFDMVMWGTPAAAIGAWIGKDLLPDDETLREQITDGLEAMIMNTFLTKLTGERTRISYQSVNPYGFDGWFKLWDAFNTEGGLGLVMASPAAQLWAKDGGRIPNSMLMMGRWLNVVDDDPENPTTFWDVTQEAAKIASGWSAYDRMKIALDTRKKLDNYGNTTLSEIATPEAIALLFGMNPQDEYNMWAASKQLDAMSKAHKDEVMKKYRDILRWTNSQLDSDKPDMERIMRTTARLMETFRDDPDGLSIVRKQWSQDMQGKEAQLATKLLRATGLPDHQNLKDIIRTSPMGDDEKLMLMQRIDDVEALRNKE